MGDEEEDLPDNLPKHPDNDRGSARQNEPTKGYIAAYCSGIDVQELTSSPTLSVLSRSTGFRTVFGHDNESNRTHQRVKLTIVTLLDGDNNQVHARMATHLVDAGRVLKEGDVMKLELFTLLTYRINNKRFELRWMSRHAA